MEQTKVSRWKWVLLLAVLFVLAAFLLLPRPDRQVPLDTPPDLEGFSVAALQQDADGIATTSGFFITSEHPLQAGQLARMMTMEPFVDLQVTGSADSREFTITPTQELRTDTLYNLLLSNRTEGGDQLRRYAFQTKATFSLDYKFPTGDGVPVETGIELHFTGGYPVDLPRSFTLSPAISGRFEEVRGSFVFVPDQPLAYATTYTVSLSASLSSEAGAPLGQLITFSFTTQPNPDVALVQLHTPVVETFTTDSTPVIELDRTGQGDAGVFDLQVLRYPDHAAFTAAMRALHDTPDAPLPLDGLPPVTTLSQEVQRYETISASRDFLLLDEPLPIGWYLVDITGTRPDNGQRYNLQKLLQVHDTTVVAMSAGGGVIVWANSAATGQPIIGATVYLDGISTAMTDGDGLARFETPDITAEDFHSLTLEQGGRIFVADLTLQPPQEAVGAQRYYTALYSDREVYLPTDTIRIWGVIRPRVGAVTPREVTLRMGSTEQVVSVGAFGSFETSFALKRHASKWQTIELIAEGHATNWRYIQILDYDKPIYDGTLSLDRNVYFPGESASLEGSVYFYDGTRTDTMPLTLIAAIDWQPVEDISLAARQGEFSASLPLPQDNDTDWRPRRLHYTVRNAQAEDAIFERSADALYYPTDLMVETRETVEPRQTSEPMGDEARALSVSLHTIDRTKARAAGEGYTPDLIRGAAVDRPVTWTVIRHNRVREPIGSHYDFINKIEVPEYRVYETQETLVTSQPQPTQSGGTTIPLSEHMTDNSYLEVVIETSDRTGRMVRESATVYPDAWNSWMDGFQWPESRLQRTDTDTDTEQWQAALGQQATFVLLDGNTEIPAQRTLLVPVGHQLFPPAVFSGNSASLTFDESHLPNVQLYAAYFDGRHPHLVVNPSFLSFNPAQRTLKVTLTTDKSRYQPGDEVTLEAKVTDPSGNPVQAQLCISVVDEAAFAAGPQDYDLPGELYRSIETAKVSCYVSYLDHTRAIFSGRGSGDGTEGYRTEFSDNPAFLNLTTDTSGEAIATFRLADSLTNWRITALAAGDGPMGGKEVVNVQTGLPFFATAILGSQVTEWDDIVVSLRGFGDALSPNSIVAFACELQQPNGSAAADSQTGNGQTGEYVNFNFGKLPTGSYTLQIVARSGAHSDALQLPIEVFPTLVEVPVVRSLSPTQLDELTPARFPVDLTLLDTQLRPWVETLYTLLGWQGGRADRQLAAGIAQRQFSLLEGRESGQTPTQVPELPVYLDAVSLFPYSDDDTLLTAKVAMVAPESLPGGAQYFQSRLQDNDLTPSEMVACYLGLAALKQPVLRDLRRLAEGLQSGDDRFFSLPDQLILTTALAAIGDETTARTVYRRLVTPMLERDADGFLSFQTNDPDDRVELTALALAAASLSVREDASALAAYLNAHPSDSVLPVLEQAVFIQQPPPSGQELQATLTSGGQSTPIPLRRGLAFLSLDQSDWEGAVIEGDESLTLMARYAGGPDQLSGQNSQLGTVDRMVEALDTGGLHQSGLVRVTLTANASDALTPGAYSMIDALPAGMRFVGLPQESWSADGMSGWIVSQVDGQRLSFLCLPQPGDPPPPLVYYARLVLPGDYTFESPYLLQCESGAIIAGRPQALTILP